MAAPCCSKISASAHHAHLPDLLNRVNAAFAGSAPYVSPVKSAASARRSSGNPCAGRGAHQLATESLPSCRNSSAMRNRLWAAGDSTARARPRHSTVVAGNHPALPGTRPAVRYRAQRTSPSIFAILEQVALTPRAERIERPGFTTHQADAFTTSRRPNPSRPGQSIARDHGGRRYLAPGKIRAPRCPAMDRAPDGRRPSILISPDLVSVFPCRPSTRITRSNQFVGLQLVQ